jgi:hypothetical protein
MVWYNGIWHMVYGMVWILYHSYNIMLYLPYTLSKLTYSTNSYHLVAQALQVLDMIGVNVDTIWL